MNTVSERDRVSRRPANVKGETSTGLCGMGNQNPRNQTEGAPDGSIVMRLV